MFIKYSTFCFWLIATLWCHIICSPLPHISFISFLFFFFWVLILRIHFIILLSSTWQIFPLLVLPSQINCKLSEKRNCIFCFFLYPSPILSIQKMLNKALLINDFKVVKETMMSPAFLGFTQKPVSRWNCFTYKLPLNFLFILSDVISHLNTEFLNICHSSP